MKEFLKYTLAAIVGTGLVLGVLFMIFIGVIVGITSGISDEKDTKVEPNSVLVVDLSYALPERTNENPLANFDFASMDVHEVLGLNDVLANIEKAKTDDNIKGIYLKLGLMPNGFATIEAIRNKLKEFKESGKFIVAYGEVVTQKSYYLASVANEIYVNPVGYLELKGFASQLFFVKNLLDRLEIDMNIFYCGQYKSATEPLRYTKMSDPNRAQIDTLLSGVYGKFIGGIAAERKVDSAKVDMICDSLLVRQPQDALNLGLIDGVKYYDEVLQILAEKTGTEKVEDLETLSLNKYDKAPGKKADYSVKDKIAVLYATGNIVDGKGEEDNIGSERFADAIREIRENDKIKALVLRINSGGGSALASDIILREITLAKEKMPVIVSMGDVAASGGYYIACEGDVILAEPNTITGSIGVFGVLPNLTRFFNDKMGITFDGVKTGTFSDLGSTVRRMTHADSVIIQSGVDSVYLKFRSRVAAGRDLDLDYVSAIAQGRVYTGMQAKTLGLVDTLGGLDMAIALAKDKAGLESYRLVSYPKQENPLEKFLSGKQEELETRMVSSYLGEYYPMWKKAHEATTMEGIQARMPFDFTIE